MSKQKTSLVPLISTIIVAVLAIAVVIVALLLITGDNGTSSADSGTPDTSVSESFKPTQELVEDCTYAAHDLVADNYRIVRLFVTEGLAYEPEPYGNLPEDGLYTVSSSEYKTLEQIEELVNSVFVEEEAVRVLDNIDGKGLAVYQNREKLVRVEDTASATAEAAEESASVQYRTEYVLGISADFAPDESYTKDWSSCRIAIIPRSETLCDLTVYLDGLDENTATEADSDSVLKMTMVKVEQDWRLEKFVY